jgi:asparagine synthase (glutamine-hydrolysing)
MSAILGLFNFDGRREPASVVREMLSRMHRRGDERSAVWSEDGAVLAVSRYAWESEPGFAGSAMVVREGDCLVAADASIYYQDDLRRRLGAAGAAVSGDTPSHLILAAYRAWGERCAEELEGDFAFVIWDRRRSRVICGRDHSGMRPLYYADLGETLIVASTMGALIAHPRCPEDLDLANVALDAAGLIFAGTTATCYRAVQALPAGATGTRTSQGGTRVSYWWDPQVPSSPRRASFDSAAQELRSILGDAVEQRLHPEQSSTLWLSGGWDSSAIFGTGQQRLGARGDLLRAVSASYPAGDSARENELIQAIADHWKTSVHWMDGSALPLMDVSAPFARQRDEPYTFAFESLMRHLARATRETDSHVALNGNGGNFLFESSPVFLADLLAGGRLPTLLREWRAMNVKRERIRYFFKWAVQPLLPLGLLSGIGVLRGRHLHGTYERPLPSWLRPEFVSRHGLAERARRATPHASRGSRSGHELHWFMTHPVFPRLNAFTSGYPLEGGVELRAPLYDRRVIRFAAAGPWSERFSGGASKRLLRHAMRGLLPESVLADRPKRTGTLASYFARSLNALLPSLERLFDQPVVAELGIVDPVALRQDLETYRRGRGHLYLREQLLSLAHVESWLRAREDLGASRPISHMPAAPLKRAHNRGTAESVVPVSGTSRQPSIRRQYVQEA